MTVQRPVRATVTVEKTHRGAVTSSSSDSPTLGLLPVEGPPAEVGLEVGQTINTGDYNSVRAVVTVRVPVTANDAAVDAAFDRAQAWATRKLAAVLAQAVEATTGPSSRANPFG